MLMHSFCVVVHGSPCVDKSVCFVVHTYSLQGDEIGDDGAQALGEGLQHCTNLQELKLVMCVLT